MAKFNSNYEWHLGGLTSSDNTAKVFYDGERNNAGYGSNPTTYIDEIGLMYPSDYGYVASPDAWITNLSSYGNSSVNTNNWLYMGLYEWIITPVSSFSYNSFRINPNGAITYRYANNAYAIRPVFYLRSSVKYSKGNGSLNNPFRIEI